MLSSPRTRRRLRTPLAWLPLAAAAVAALALLASSPSSRPLSLTLPAHAAPPVCANSNLQKRNNNNVDADDSARIRGLSRIHHAKRQLPQLAHNALFDALAPHFDDAALNDEDENTLNDYSGRAVGDDSITTATATYVPSQPSTTLSSGTRVFVPCTTLPVSDDGRCGRYGGGKRCRDGLCCSRWGYCQDNGGDSGSDWCSASAGCQAGYGKCWYNRALATNLVGGVCPTPAPAPNPTKSWAVTTVSKSVHVYQVCPTLAVSDNGRCGPQGGNKRCPDGLCCSEWGWCEDDGGDSGLHWCGGGCQLGYGKCFVGCDPVKSNFTCDSLTGTAPAEPTPTDEPTDITVTSATYVSRGTPVYAACTNIPISDNVQCGAQVGKRCKDGTCCSQWGVCQDDGGNSGLPWCGAGCQLGYGKCFYAAQPERAATFTCPRDVPVPQRITTTRRTRTTVFSTRTRVTKTAWESATVSRGTPVYAVCTELPLSVDGCCGPKVGRRCGQGYCCSQWGYCEDDGNNNGEAWCGAGCLLGWGKCHVQNTTSPQPFKCPSYLGEPTSTTTITETTAAPTTSLTTEPGQIIPTTTTIPGATTTSTSTSTPTPPPVLPCSAGPAYAWSEDIAWSPSSTSQWSIILGPLGYSTVDAYLYVNATAFSLGATNGCTKPGVPNTNDACGTRNGAVSFTVSAAGIDGRFTPGLDSRISEAHIWYGCTKPTGAESVGSFPVSQSFRPAATLPFTLSSVGSFPVCAGGYYVMIQAQAVCTAEQDGRDVQTSSTSTVAVVPTSTATATTEAASTTVPASTEVKQVTVEPPRASSTGAATTVEAVTTSEVPVSTGAPDAKETTTTTAEPEPTTTVDAAVTTKVATTTEAVVTVEPAAPTPTTTVEEVTTSKTATTTEAPVVPTTTVEPEAPSDVKQTTTEAPATTEVTTSGTKSATKTPTPTTTVDEVTTSKTATPTTTEAPIVPTTTVEIKAPADVRPTTTEAPTTTPTTTETATTTKTKTTSTATQTATTTATTSKTKTNTSTTSITTETVTSTSATRSTTSSATATTSRTSSTTSFTASTSTLTTSTDTPTTTATQTKSTSTLSTTATATQTKTTSTVTTTATTSATQTKTTTVTTTATQTTSTTTLTSTTTAAAGGAGGVPKCAAQPWYTTGSSNNRAGLSFGLGFDNFQTITWGDYYNLVESESAVAAGGSAYQAGSTNIGNARSNRPACSTQSTTDINNFALVAKTIATGANIKIDGNNFATTSGGDTSNIAFLGSGCSIVTQPSSWFDTLFSTAQQRAQALSDALASYTKSATCYIDSQNNLRIDAISGMSSATVAICDFPLAGVDGSTMNMNNFQVSGFSATPTGYIFNVKASTSTVALGGNSIAVFQNNFKGTAFFNFPSTITKINWNSQTLFAQGFLAPYADIVANTGTPVDAQIIAKSWKNTQAAERHGFDSGNKPGFNGCFPPITLY